MGIGIISHPQAIVTIMNQRKSRKRNAGAILENRLKYGMIIVDGEELDLTFVLNVVNPSRDREEKDGTN